MEVKKLQIYRMEIWQQNTCPLEHGFFYTLFWLHTNVVRTPENCEILTYDWELFTSLKIIETVHFVIILLNSLANIKHFNLNIFPGKGVRNMALPVPIKAKIRW